MTRWLITRRRWAASFASCWAGCLPSIRARCSRRGSGTSTRSGGRPGLPEDVAALVDSLKDDSTSLVLVNLNQSETRTVIVQGGAYGEHLCEQVDAGTG